MKRKLFSILIAVMVIYLVGSTYIYANSQQMVASVEAETTKVAKDAGLTNITDFYVFNKDETYYAVMGENRSEERRVGKECRSRRAANRAGLSGTQSVS